MQNPTIRPRKLTVERLSRIADHLEKTRPRRPKITEVVDWLAWHVDQQLSQGTLTQREIVADAEGVQS